jgi:hypothetical protein
VGRPNKNLASNFKERLEWFSIDRYDRLEQLDTLGWFKQLQVRRSLYGRLTREFPSRFEAGNERPMVWNDARMFLSVIKEAPILDFEEEPQFEAEIPRLKTPVHSTTIEEFYLGELDAKQQRIAQARRFFDKAAEFRFEAWRDGHRLDFYGSAKDVASVIDGELTASGETEGCTVLDYRFDGPFSREFFFDEDIRHGKWAELPLHEHLGLHGVGILSVDLSMPESVLVEHFQAVINQLKTEQQKLRAGKLNPAAWVRCGLLPFIDLELWRLTEALPKYGKNVVRIPDPLMKELILKEDKSAGSKHASPDHTIRTVTRKYFNRMFAAHSSLFALLESEATGQFHHAGITPRFQRYKMRKRRDEKKKKTNQQKLL